MSERELQTFTAVYVAHGRYDELGLTPKTYVEKVQGYNIQDAVENHIAHIRKRGRHSLYAEPVLFCGDITLRRV
jgi:hypothetical protein